MPSHLLSWITFTPLIGMIAVLAAPQRSLGWIRGLSLAATFVPLVLATAMYLAVFQSGTADYHLVERCDWIRTIRAEYHIGIDGLSLALVWLSTLLAFIAVPASFSVARAGKAYFALLLLLEVGILGVLVSLDYFLFFVFLELTLLPIYFLVGIWGGEQRESAALKFCLHSSAGSLLILVALVALRLDGGTFSIPALIELAQGGKLSGANLPDGGVLLGMPFRTWCFWCLFAGFALKIPLVPLSSWLADVQAEAPAPIAMLVAGIVMKLGAFGLLRACFPILPGAFHEFAFLLCVLGVSSMVYGAFLALGQTDFRRLAACFGLSQMGLILLGTAALTKAGVSGAALALFQHGTSMAALTLVVGMFCDKIPHSRLGDCDGLFRATPRFLVCSSLACFAALGGPGLLRFSFEISTMIGAYHAADARFRSLTIIAGVGLLIGTVALLGALKKVCFGVRNPLHEEALDLNARELFCLAPLLALCFALGAFPHLLFEPLAPSVAHLIQLLHRP